MFQIRILISIAFLFLYAAVFSQTTYLPEKGKAYPLIDRLEIKYGKSNNLNFSTIKPFSRKSAMAEVLLIDSLTNEGQVKLTAVDRYNIHSFKMDNSEWAPAADSGSFASKRPVWNTFYKNPANLLEVNVKDFFLVVNPVLNFQLGGGGNDENNLFLNKRGVTLRGMIASKIGFSTTITENQERGPQFFRSYTGIHRAVPGVGFYKRFKTTGYDYFDGRGYFTFGITKYIGVQFGYDKNFIGDGYRSLFLDDFGNSYLFLKLNTKIWKLNYQNLFMELMPQFVKKGDNLLDRKYAAMHHLSINATRWLNVGVFEGVVFSRRNHFDFAYLNPIIFLRHIEGALGSPDKAKAGIDFKANALKSVQFYGQFLLDEFLVNEIFKNNGFWANKYGYQLGIKYVDAFAIPNLDLQIESNRVRPFTYTHNDSLTDYSHYNLPLAHPLGANFQEVVGVVRYQPFNKWHIDARAIYYYQGKDTLNENFGSNIFAPYTTRSRDYGYYVGDGNKIKVFNASATLGYELKENLFLEGNILFRKETGTDAVTYFNIGLRLNTARRDYNY